MRQKSRPPSLWNSSVQGQRQCTSLERTFDKTQTSLMEDVFQALLFWRGWQMDDCQRIGRRRDRGYRENLSRRFQVAICPRINHKIQYLFGFQQNRNSEFFHWSDLWSSYRLLIWKTANVSGWPRAISAGWQFMQKIPLKSRYNGRLRGWTYPYRRSWRSLAGSPRNREVIWIWWGGPNTIEVGGGIRDIKAVEFYVSHGIRWLFWGRRLWKWSLCQRGMPRCFRGHVMVGIDAKDGLAAIEDGRRRPLNRLLMLPALWRLWSEAVIYTDIKRDGMNGINIEATRFLPRPLKFPWLLPWRCGIEDIKKVVNRNSRSYGYHCRESPLYGRALFTGGNHDGKK